MRKREMGRRLMAMGLSVLLGLSVTACGGNASSEAAAPGTTEARTFALADQAETASEEGNAAAGSAAEGNSAAAAAAEGSDAIAPGAEGSTGSGETKALPAGNGKSGQEAASVPLHLEICDYYHLWYDPDKTESPYAMLGSVETEGLFLSPEDAENYPALGKALEQWGQGTFARMKEEMAEYLTMFDDVSPEELPLPELYETGEVRIRRADSDVLSYVSRIEAYAGGAHEGYFYGGYNFDPKTGKEIILTDVIRDTDALPELLYPALLAEQPYADELGYADILTLLKEKELDTYSFTVEQDGVRFWFSPYEIASFAAGMLSADISFAEHPEVFTGKYQNAPARWARPYHQHEIIRFRQGEKSRVLMVGVRTGENGSESDDSYDYSYNDYDYGAFEAIKLSLDGRETETVFDGYDYRPILLCVDGSYYLYIVAQTDNDWHVLLSYDLNGESAVETGAVPGLQEAWRNLSDSYVYREYDYSVAHEEDSSENPFSDTRQILLTDPDNMRLAVRLELLSTYSGFADFYAGRDGAPVRRQAYYEIPDSDFTKLTLLQDLELSGADPETLEPKGIVFLKKGTVLHFYRTDGESTLWMRTEDGRCVEIVLENEAWPVTVNGIEAEELFEGMLYAG